MVLNNIQSTRINLLLAIFQPFIPTEHGFKPIEAILLLGEPLNWESALQLVIDTLITDGKVGFIFIFSYVPEK